MILFVTQNFLPDVGGTQQYMTGLADALHRRGHAIEIFCRATSRSAARAFDATRTYSIRRFGGLRPVRQVLTRMAVVERLKAGDVTTIVTDTWKSLEPLPAAVLRSVRVVCLAHGNEFLAETPRRVERVKRSVAKADIVAANSHFTADIVKEFGGVAEVLLPGITPPAGADTTATTRSVGTRLLTLARLEPRKGVDRVIRALAQLVPSYPDIEYDIVGKGEDRPRLEALAAELGVNERVHFHGYVSEARKAEMLSQASVFVLPNRREPGSVEGFGLVFLEAAAYGVPSVAGNDGGTGDAVLDGITGRVVDGMSKTELTEALSQLLGNEKLRQGMGEAARKRFWREFAWDAAIARFEKVLAL